MSLRRRILRLLGMATVICAFAGYFAFSTFFFSPLEDDFEFGLATLVPRDVDFFVAKSGLADEFDGFPRLAVTDELAATHAGRTFFESDTWQQFRANYDIEGQLKRLEEALDQAPIAIDPLGIFGGNDVVVAGYFRSSELSRADFVALGRTNWMGKMGQSALSYPSLFGLEDQGYSVAEANGVVSLTGGTLSRTLHIARIRDVLVVGSDHALVLGAIELEAKKGQDSFGQSSRYADYIVNRANREPGDIELFVDHDAVMANKLRFGHTLWTGAVPDGESDSFSSSFLSRIGQLSLLKEFEGVIGFEGGLAIDLHADLLSEKLNPRQKRFYRQPGFNREVINKVADMAPADTGILAYMQADIADILRMVLESTEPALQANFHDLVRSVWSHRDGTVLFDDLDSGLKNRVALIVRANDYTDEGETGPPHDDTPTFAWAVVGWVKKEETLNEFRSKIISNQGRFSIQGRESGAKGVFTNKVAGGVILYEYWSQFVPGTGHLSSVVTDDIFIIGNHHKLLESILLTKLNDAEHPRLADEPMFSSLVNLGLDNASGFAYMNPSLIADSMRSIAYDTASNSIDINWKLERPRITSLVLRSDFGGMREEDLNPVERGAFDRALQLALDDFEDAFLKEHVGRMNEGFGRTITYLEAMKAGLFELALDPKRVDLSLRTIVPLTPAQ